MPERSVFQSQLEDSEAFSFLDRWEALNTATRAISARVSEGDREKLIGDLDFADIKATIEGVRRGEMDLKNAGPAAAMVMFMGYPSLLIRNGNFDPPLEGIWRERLTPNRETIKRVIASVGGVRFEMAGRDTMIGTCWLVDDDVLITNRDVAKAFFELRGSDVRANSVDLFNTEALGYLIDSIIGIEQTDNVAMALLKLGRGVGRRLGLDPIPLDDRLSAVEFIGVVGYPARDVRDNPLDVFDRYFGHTFEDKRFAPGKVMDANHQPTVFTHNCTTLGNNSGSVVFDVSSGNAIGLHVAGNRQTQNLALKAKAIKQALVEHGRRVYPIPAGNALLDRKGHETHLSAGTFRDRNGYEPDFLGDGHLEVALPILSPQLASQVAITSTGEREIKYRNFSVVMCRPRRLAYFTAVNINCNYARNPPRVCRFSLDPRIASELQTGEELYSGNDHFDCGQLVRRLDPCWGTAEQASQANIDSMYFPNIVPQHKQLNQEIWNDIEDYILSTVTDRDPKISVFTGCVFKGTDPTIPRTRTKVPSAFWKVIVSVMRQRNRPPRLQAQAFILSQERLLPGVDFERAPEAHPHHDVLTPLQVTIEQLERTTGLDFQNLKRADSFSIATESEYELRQGTESTEDDLYESYHFKPLTSINDIEAGFATHSSLGTHAWLSDGVTPLEKGRTYRICVSVSPQPDAPVFRLVASSNSAIVFPPQQTISPAAFGQRVIVSFKLTPQANGTVTIRLGLYQDHSLALLDESILSVQVGCLSADLVK